MRKAVENWNGGIKISSTKINSLRYAADATLIAASDGGLIDFLRVENMSKDFFCSII